MKNALKNFPVMNQKYEELQTITRIAEDLKRIEEVQTAGNAGSTQVGNLQLADFVNPAGLQPIGGNLFLETGASGSPQSGTPGDSGLGQLTQGSLESSNVNVVQELVDMIETQRAYEVNARAISTADQMLQYTTNNL